MAIDVSAIQEAFRRRAGQAPSTAGIPGGAPTANAPTPGNPLTVAPGASPAGTAPQPPQSMTEEPRKQLAQSQPGEAEIILKALSKRLDKLGEQGV